MQYTDFFLGAGSPTGFVGYFNQLTKPELDLDVTLIKAGPGCGKSTFMRSIADHLAMQGHSVELIHCSSDSDSLDGVICTEKGFAIIDATAPHVVEPEYPGAVEKVVSFFDFLDNDKLRVSREQIVELFKRNKCFHDRATRYITAAGSLVQDSMRVAGFCTDTQKLEGFCRRFCAKRIKPNDDKGQGREHMRLLGAITPKGFVFYGDTVLSMAQDVVVIDDRYGFISKKILSVVRDDAISKGLDVYTCYCAMSPYEKIEHIIIPSLSLAIVTRNEFTGFEFGNVEVIKSSRFLIPEQLRGRKKRLKFNRTTTVELLSQAQLMLSQAKSVHDDIEKYYVDAMDFGALKAVFEQVTSKL